jgi:septal ring-binding cell division protein DamX
VKPGKGKESAAKPSGEELGKKGTPSIAVSPAATAPSGAGRYTVQVSSWKSKGKANSQAQQLSSAGFDAYVMDMEVNGEQWHRVRVGRYGTKGEAREAIAKLEAQIPDGLWIDTMQ